MKLIIQIPCYNEAKDLPVTLSHLPQKIMGIDLIEILIIDDGSTDNTVQVARRCGVQHVLSFPENKGLATAFASGLDACLRLGADIIVNTDADNQYCGADVEVLVRPLIERKAEIVIGERPIDKTKEFSWTKKKLQHLGSWVVRLASGTDIPDAPSGFRAFSRDAAMKLNIISEYTYTLETIIQAGRKNMSISSVPVRTNPSLRKSRLFRNTFQYIMQSILTIFRIFVMYRPLRFFSALGAIFLSVGFVIAIRFLALMLFWNDSAGHVQSLLLSVLLIVIGFQTIFMGIQGDLIASNRKIIENIQYHIRQIVYDRDPLQIQKRNEEEEKNSL